MTARRSLCAPGTAAAEDVQAACAREAAKIRTHLRDLDEAVADLERERGGLARSITEGTARYREANQQVQRVLRPRLAEGIAELRRSQLARERVLHDEADLEHRAALLERRHDIERALIQLATALDASAPAADAPYQEFAATIEELLAEWRYPESSPSGSTRRRWTSSWRDRRVAPMGRVSAPSCTPPS